MDTIRKVRSILAGSESVVVLTGSGVSSDSGIPTFRGPEGLWRNFRPEDLATPEAFARDPRLVWEWYNWRRELIASKAPNAAHRALALMEEQRPDFLLITQNVDGFHEKAGNRKLAEIHGNIWKVRCTGCGEVRVCNDVPIAILPMCAGCGGLLRPHIVWFGESLDHGLLENCMEAIERCSAFLVIGTSGVVQPAASFASMAKAAGAFVIEVNIEASPNAAYADAVLTGRASEVVPMLVNG
jgi:NAD-dependent deacetylase